MIAEAQGYLALVPEARDLSLPGPDTIRLVLLTRRGVPCDSYLTVRGTIVTPEGTPVDGCTLTAAEAPEANVLPGVSPFADRYILQIVDCPGGAASRTIPLDLADVHLTPHDLGRIVVVTQRP